MRAATDADYSCTRPRQHSSDCGTQTAAAGTGYDDNATFKL
jgi:hypothetical protein